MTHPALVYYAVGACAALGAALLYALALILAAVLVKESRDFYKFVTMRRRDGSDSEHTRRDD
jgi:hypothetical protein